MIGEAGSRRRLRWYWFCGEEGAKAGKGGWKGEWMGRL